MKTPHTRVWLLSLITILLCVTFKTQAEVKTHPPENAAEQLRKLERQIKRKRLSESVIGDHTKQVVEYRNQAAKCISEGEAEQKQVEQDLTNLGEKVKGENWEVTSKRQSLEKDKALLERNLAQCRLILLRSDDIYQSLLDYQKQLTKQHLLNKGPDILSLLKDNWQQPGLWITASRQFIFTDSGLDQFITANWLSLIWGFLLSLLLAVAARLFLVYMIGRGHWRVDYTSRFLCATLTSLRHYAIPTFGTLFFINFIALYYTDVPDFLGAIMLALPIYFLLITTVRSFLTPPPPAVSFVALHKVLAHRFAQRINYLLGLLLVGYLVFQTILSQSLPEPALLLTRGIFAAFFILNLIWLVLLLAKVPRYADATAKRFVLIAVIASTLLIEWLGYRNLSFYILRALIGTVIAIGLFSLIKRLLAESCQGLATGRASWHRKIRHWLAVKPGESIPGLGWLRFVVNLSLWIGLVWILMRVWDFSEASWQQLITSMQSGFTVGSLNIIPTRILLAIGSFALLTLITGWIKNWLAKHWLVKSRLDRGAREATETISGYIGFAITLIVSLSVAGVDFTHLALIAGALSVGIGFGLQNIVNNFVSGLILLFERPIKTGDWIVVGNTEGYVKRIRIRSTQIQTFDRADVIVPNSELISGQVTNWMLHDTQGRVNIQVGVAYGSDTEKVRDILMQVAMSHPLVIQDIDGYKPWILFRNFGESSLDFELRVYVKNIDKRLSVISDLNFAIDKAFRDNNIEIPFPQRDLHIRSMPESLKGIDKNES
jgi:small-conductance mechanosensitive channel